MNKYFLIFLSFFVSLNFLQASTTTTSLAQNIASSVFIDQNKFYVGTDAPNDVNSIVSVELGRVDGQLKANFVSKSPAAGVNVNGTAKQSSSMYSQKIDKLATQKASSTKTYLVAAHNVSNTDNASLNSIALIDFSTKPVSEFTNTNPINDASGTVLQNNDFAALTASPDYVFVAVPPSAGVFGSANSGIVRLKKATSVSSGLQVQNENGATKAYAILLSAVETENIPSNSSVNFAVQGQGDTINYTLGTITDMWWDSKLNRLYIGLTNATTEATQPTAGACSLLVGYIADNKLLIRTAIPLQVVVTSDSQNSIICYSAKNPNTQAVSAFKVRTMHTSTGKDYVILVGDVSAAGTDETRNKYLNTQVNVYALPLTILATDSSTNGMIATKNSDNQINFNSAVSDPQYLMNKSTDNARVAVGANPQYLVHATNLDAAFIDAAITDMQVIGDTVYISQAGTRGNPNGDTAGEAGFFSSTAIFGTDGAIRSWTPWSRAVCSANKTDADVVTDKVFSFGFDKTTSNAWYTVKDTKVGTVTLWNAGAINLHTEPGTLSTVLQPFFKDGFGITNLINFDDETPGFLSWDPPSEYPAFSMMVATGNNKVALIQTGDRDSNDVFQPTTVYSNNADPQNIFEFNNSDIQIGVISCAEVSRSTEDEKGWLFIGGSNGLSVIRSDDGGMGWTDLAKLDKTDYPWTGYSFKILTDSSGNGFTNIIKLIADGTYLYVITSNKIYAITMNADDFYVGKISTNNLKSVQSSAMIFDAMLIDNSTALNPVFALATEGGVQIATWNGNTLDLKSAKDAQTPSQDFVSGPAIKFNFISTQRGGKLDSNKKASGNLYVTAFNSQTLDNLYVYRFDVQSGNDTAKTVGLNLLNEPYTETGVTQKYFYKIASFDKLEKRLYIKQILDQSMQQHHFTSSLAITPDPEKFLPDSSEVYKAIDLGIKTNKIPLFGTVTQDSASGTQYIAGSFGLVANE